MKIIDNTPTQKTVTIDNPDQNVDKTIFRTLEDISLKKLSNVVRGSGSYSWTLRFAPDRSSTGTEVIVSGSVTNSESGQEITSFDNPNIPSGDYVWLEGLAVSGTVNEFHLTVDYQ